MTPENDDFTRYVILLKHADVPMTVEHVRAHVQHLKALEEQAKLEMCGPFDHEKGGMIILKVGSFQEAKELAEADPFVRDGVETYELLTGRLSCQENNHMGMA